jgi:hypothetical protein
MARTIEILRQDTPPERRALAAPATAGGSASDAVQLPGAPAGALRLVPADAGLVIEVHAVGVRVAGRPAAPGSRRLVVSGERVELLGHSVALASEAPPEGTRAIAGALLREAAAGAAPMTAPHLVVLTGPRAGARLTLRERLSIGRGRAADVVVPDPEASRVHARVRLGADGATVEDLGSKNGVRLNGVRVERGPQPLRPGDEFTIGETLLRLADPLEALARRPTAGDPSPTSPRRRRTFAPEIAAAALLALSAAALALAS